ncbi:multicopper oxidase MmcO [Reticulibacter mediterranei]|uniref:Multicopper oxidase MmcO n=1 Tax=Reticulibacter mediterranei TaxID=2778369 RepID=A0A8J3ISC8_9CHLR|nr:multicopper oxidase family protein [Reticulibacter mediterranei]GHP01160.1 multicopper oxidase MmcO [Reticulibacter mediterranei]
MKQESTFPHKRSGFTRREFLLFGSLGVGLGVGAGVVTFNGPALWQQMAGAMGMAGVQPSFPRTASTGKTRTYTLEAAPARVMIDGKEVSTWAYNGMLPGPEIHASEGDRLRVIVKNRLPEGTTIHWHGVPLVNPMDGVPDVTQPAIKPGQDFTYDFLVPAAGTYMYHSHVGFQPDRALYGPLIVDAAKESMTYDHDFLMVFDDWLDGVSDGPGTPEQAMKQLIAGGDNMGSMGNMGGMNQQVPPDLIYPFYLINGKSSAHPLELKVSRGQKARIRLINASASTIYRVALQGHRMTVTHTDGNPVEPVEVDAIRIGMGERYDVLISANNPGVWQFAAQVEGAKPMVRALLRYQGSTSSAPSANFIPQEMTRQLLTYPMLKAAPGIFTPPDQNPDQILPIELSGGMGRYTWKMNNEVFEKAQQIAVSQNRLIRFQFKNKSMMPHPMHLHGHFFQVDNGTGRGPLKDTVLVDAMQNLTINWVADNPGAWAFHCHMRYHEMAGMMRVVKVS